MFYVHAANTAVCRKMLFMTARQNSQCYIFQCLPQSKTFHDKRSEHAPYFHTHLGATHQIIAPWIINYKVIKKTRSTRSLQTSSKAADPAKFVELFFPTMVKNC